MLTVKSVSLSNFQSVSTTQTVDNLPSAGLIGLDGLNQTTGGSSASGKSTFLRAIASVLGVNSVPMTKLANIYSEGKPSATVTFVSPIIGEVTISVGAKPSVFQGGVQVAATGSEVSKYVENMFGIPSKVLKSLCYRAQGERGLFTGLSPAERQSFLNDVLGLDKYESAAETIQKQIKDLKAQNAAIEVKLQTLESVLPAEPKTYEVLPVPSADQLETDLKAASSRLLRSRGDLKQAQDESSERCTVIQREIQDVQLKIAQALSESDSLIKGHVNVLTEGAQNVLREEQARLDSATKAARAKIDTYHAQAAGVSELIADKAKKQSEIDKIVNKIGNLQSKKEETKKLLESALRLVCPTCEQEWNASSKKCEQYAQEVERLTSEIQSGQSELAAKQDAMWDTFADRDLASELAGYAAKKKAVEEKLVAVTAELNGIIEAARQEVRKAQLEDKAVLDAKLETVHNKHAQLSGELTAKQEELRTAKSVVSEKTIEVERCKLSVSELSAKVQAIEAKAQSVAKQNQDNAKRYEQSVAARNQALEVIAATRFEQSGLSKQITTQETALATIKGFLASIVEDVLAEAEHEANLLLGRFKNTAGINITFPYKAQTRNGIETYAIGLAAETNGIQLDFDANLSGGQQTSVHLAVDLAVWKILQGRQSGAVPGFFMFDEAFDGHDTAVKEACMDILAEIAQTRQIFLVDHSSEFKDYYTAKVFASFDGRATTLELR